MDGLDVQVLFGEISRIACVTPFGLEGVRLRKREKASTKGGISLVPMYE